MVFLIGTTLCYNCGYAVNPARDFGPRLFTYLAGWDFVFSNTMGYYFFIIPILGPLFGSILGTLIYYMLICNHWPKEDCDGCDLAEIKATNEPLLSESIQPTTTAVAK